MDPVRIGAMSLCAVLLANGLMQLIMSTRRFRAQEESRRLGLELLRGRLEALLVRQRTIAEPGEGWRGFRKFEVKEKVMEAKDICSLYLTPYDRKPLVSYQPGQFLTFRLAIPGQQKPLVRCYSLSDAANGEHYRVTVKKCGLASTYLVDTLKAGDLLDVQAPSGKFVLDAEEDDPVVFVAGGIGVTPVLAMLRARVARGSRQEAWFFYGVRNGHEHALRDPLDRCALSNPQVKLQVCYSDPHESDQPGRDYHHRGRVSLDLFRKLLPSNNYTFYICGPPAMMESVVSGLREWGVPEERIRSEAFGPASVKKKSVPSDGASTSAESSGVEVVFARSGKTLRWSSAAGSLLELAEASGIKIESGCRAGSCQSCLVAVKAGSIDYLSKPGELPEGGSCLTCISIPKGPLTLDA